MAKRPCAHPGCPVLLDKAGRCAKHRIESPTYLERDHAERKRRKAAVDAWVAAHGYTCPGDEAHGPHPSHDLTAEHTTPVEYGGIGSRLTVLCRSANSARRYRLR